MQADGEMEEDFERQQPLLHPPREAWTNQPQASTFELLPRPSRHQMNTFATISIYRHSLIN